MPHADPRFDFADDRVYRVFRLDIRGRVASAEVIYADSDEHAGAIAETLQSKYSLELWERSRLLAHYPKLAISGA